MLIKQQFGVGWGSRVEGRDGVLGEGIVRLKPLGVCSGTVHSNSPKRKATFFKALVAWNHS